MQQNELTLLEFWIKKFFSHGVSICGVIFGRRQTGKTDLAFTIAEICFRLGLSQHFAANVKLLEPPPFLIEHIADLQTLEGWASTNSGRSLYILDEAGKAFRRRTPMAKLNIELLDKLQIVRKYKLNIIMITPADKYIDNASLGSDVLDFVIVKTEFNNPKVADMYDTMTGEGVSLNGIPPTSIKFDTWDVAPFTLKPSVSKIAFPSKAVEVCYKNAKLGMTAKDLGIDHKQLNRYYKYSIIFFVENQVTPDTTKR